MKNEAMIHVEVDTDIKKEAEKILQELGHSPEDAIRAFYAEIVRCHGLPPEMMEENVDSSKADS